MAQHAYGRIADLGDHRDHTFQMAPSVALPPLVDLRPQCHAVEDQGQLGSCTSFAAGEAIRMAREKQGLADFVMSHLFLYFNSRLRTEKYLDSGATIRDTIKAAARMGDCPETDWPYDISKFASKPPQSAYLNALHDRVISYLRVAQDLTQLKNCLAQGFSLDIGFTVYQSFESQQVADTGMVPMPSKRESVLGGHSVLVVGYRDADKHFICKNSWSASWGDKGYFYMPYAYLQDSGLSSDFWTIRAMSV